MMRVNEPYNKQTLIELINNVEATTRNSKPMMFHPTTLWIQEIENHPDRFYIEDLQLMWLGCVVKTVSGKENMLAEKWRELIDDRTN